MTSVSLKQEVMDVCLFGKCLLPLIGLLLLIESGLSAADWRKVEGKEAADFVKAAESALSTHWEATSSGWCRAITDNGKSFVEVCWDKTGRSGLRAWIVHEGGDPAPWDSGALANVISCYGPKEQWIYSKNGNLLFGHDDFQSMRISSTHDARQHTIWLGVGEETLLSIFRQEVSSTSLDVEVNEDGGVRFVTDNALLEFDITRGFCPVLLQEQMNRDRYKRIDDALPRQYQWEVDQDIHGVWYCTRMESTWYGRGFQHEDNPIATIVEVLEYDSSPPKERMRLEYRTLNVPIGTKVSSSVPKKSGQWFYGKDGAAANSDLEKQVFRDLGKKMSERGFAKPTGEARK